MKIYTAADTPNNDSTAFKLLNMGWCRLIRTKELFEVLYNRGDLQIATQLTFDQLREVHPGLPDVVIDQADMYKAGSEALRNNILATTAHVCGSYIDLTEGGTNGKLRYVTDIKAVHYLTDVDMFFVKGLSYYLNAPNQHCLCPAVSNSMIEQWATAEMVDRLWPGAAKQIPIMQDMNYSDEEVVTTLYALTQNVYHPISMNDVTFD